MDSSFMHRLTWGLVIVAVGVIFLLNHLGVITMGVGEFFSIYWPVFIIIFGVQGLLFQAKNVFWWNPLVILIGVLFLGRNLDWFEWDIGDAMQLIWPVIVILFGVSMIFKGGRGGRGGDRGERWDAITPPPPPPPPTGGAEHAPPGPDAEGRSDRYGWDDGAHAKQQWREQGQHWREQQQHWKDQHRHWRESRRSWSGDPNRRVHSRFIGDLYLGHDYYELTPMSISHFIGDTTIDLTKAQVPIGDTRIEVSSFIGDVKVFIPNDMRLGIQVASSSLIGDVKVFDAKRGGMFNQVTVETPGYVDAEQRVILVVSSFIGDVRVMKVG